MRKIFAALIVLFGASAADAGQWVMVEHPTYMYMDCNNCTITYYKGGWYTTIPNIPCILHSLHLFSTLFSGKTFTGP